MFPSSVRYIYTVKSTKEKVGVKNRGDQEENGG